MQNQDSTVQPTSESLPIGNAMLPEVRASKKHELAEKWIKELSDAGFTHDDMIALFAEARRKFADFKKRKNQKNDIL